MFRCVNTCITCTCSCKRIGCTLARFTGLCFNFMVAAFVHKYSSPCDIFINIFDFIKIFANTAAVVTVYGRGGIYYRCRGNHTAAVVTSYAHCGNYYHRGSNYYGRGGNYYHGGGNYYSRGGYYFLFDTIFRNYGHGGNHLRPRWYITISRPRW